MDWPHVKKKFTPSELEYITKIDPKSDVEKISKYFNFRDVNIYPFDDERRFA
jgi:hypothetical protein